MKPSAFSLAALLLWSIAGTAQAALGVQVANVEHAGAGLADARHCYLEVSGHDCDGAWGTPDSPYGALLTGRQNPSYVDQTSPLATLGEPRFAKRNTGGAAAVLVNAAVLSPVPEPSKYSLLLVGLALLAFTARGEDREKFAAVSVSGSGSGRQS